MTYIEVAVASMILTILILTMIYVLQVTSKGVFKAQLKDSAMSMTREKIEDIKSEILNLPWGRANIDRQENDYNEHPLEAVTVRGRRYLMDAEVRYVNDVARVVTPEGGSNTQLAHVYEYVPTPRPWPEEDIELSNLIRIEVELLVEDDQVTHVEIDEDGKWEVDPVTNDWVLYEERDFSGAATVYHGQYRRFTQVGIVTNRELQSPMGSIVVYVYDEDTGLPLEGALVYLYRMDTWQLVKAVAADADGKVLFEDVPKSAPNYWLKSLNNYPIGYHDEEQPTNIDWPAAGLEVEEDTEHGGAIFELAQHDMGVVDGLVLIDRWEDELAAVSQVCDFTGVSRAVVSCSDLYSVPTTTDGSGYFQFSGENRLEPVTTADFFAATYNANFSFSYFNNPPTVTALDCDDRAGLTNGLSGAVTGVTIHAEPTVNAPLTIVLWTEYFTVDLVGQVTGYDEDLPPDAPITLAAAHPITVTVVDGAPQIFGDNPVTIDQTTGGFTVKSGLGLHSFIVEPKDQGAGNVPYYAPLSFALPAPVTCDATCGPISVDVYPLQPVGTLVGSVGGMGVAYDYSDIIIGVYNAGESEPLVAFNPDANGEFEHNWVPTSNESDGRELDVRPILSNEFANSPDEITEFVTFGSAVTLPDNADGFSFTISRENAYIEGWAVWPDLKPVRNGLLVMAVPNGKSFPGSLSPGTTYYYSACTDSEGHFKVRVGIIGGTTTLYDVRCYNQLNDVDEYGQPTYIGNNYIENPQGPVTVDIFNTIDAPAGPVSFVF